MNAHEGKAGVVLFAGKLCDPRLSALSVVATIKALYKYTSFLSFPFRCIVQISRPSSNLGVKCQGQQVQKNEKLLTHPH